MSSQDQQQVPSPSQGRSPIVVTNIIKLAGVMVVVIGLARNDLQTGHIALAAFMMAGAQGLETFLTSFFGGEKK